LLGALVAEGFDSRLTLLLDADLPDPELPPGGYALAGSRRRYRGQLSAYEEAVALGADLQRIKPDVYHAIDLRLPGRSSCPLVVTLHDLIPWAWGGSRMRGERLRFWLGKRLLKRADAVLAVSQATARDAERYASVVPNRIRVVYEAADRAFEPRPGAAARVATRVRGIAAAARRVARAGADAAAGVAVRVRNCGPDCGQNPRDLAAAEQQAGRPHDEHPDDDRADQAVVTLRFFVHARTLSAARSCGER